MNILKTLKEELADGADFDIAEFVLAVRFGLMRKEEEFQKVKHVFWATFQLEMPS